MRVLFVALAEAVVLLSLSLLLFLHPTTLTIRVVAIIISVLAALSAISFVLPHLVLKPIFNAVGACELCRKPFQK